MSFVDINVLKRFAVNDQWLAASTSDQCIASSIVVLLLVVVLVAAAAAAAAVVVVEILHLLAKHAQEHLKFGYVWTKQD
jgi:hypothetical protein